MKTLIAIITLVTLTACASTTDLSIQTKEAQYRAIHSGQYMIKPRPERMTP